MKICMIQNLNAKTLTNINNKLASNSISNIKISFKSNTDNFEKQNIVSNKHNVDYEKVENLLSILDNKLKMLIQEGNDLKNRHFESSREKLIATIQYNQQLDELRNDYKKIKEMLSPCKTNDINKTAEIITNFLQDMEKMGQNKGFNRVVGYDNIKSTLKNKFIFDSILKDKISESANVPNAFLFYGPTGNGKTTFAKAVAEQALMTPYIVNASNIDEEEAMNLIESYAKQSKKQNENSKNKQHSIIIVDECDSLTQENSPVIERFKSLIQNCSKEYNCTLFLTTNNPLDLPQEILSKDVTPLKVAIAPPDDITVKAIIDKKLKQANCIPEDGTKKIVEEMFNNNSRKYSNGDVDKIINNILMLKLNPTTQDFIDYIRQDILPPSITSKKMKKFQDEMEKLK